jgi:hypothetical protein
VCWARRWLGGGHAAARGGLGRPRRGPRAHVLNLKPARFRPDPEGVVPPSSHDNVDQEYRTLLWLQGRTAESAYANRTAHPVSRGLPAKLAERFGSDLAERRVEDVSGAGRPGDSVRRAECRHWRHWKCGASDCIY